MNTLSNVPTQTAPLASVPTARLVRDCLNGNEDAWLALVDRYKNLIYSIPFKHGLPADDAAEIFQSVCLSLLSELSKIQDPQALPAWLIQVTARRCAMWQRGQQPFLSVEEDELEAHVERKSSELAREQLREIELEQMLRDARAALSPQCQQLIEMLFDESPARPYEEVAAALGLATGSIGLTRKRCLDYLRKNLERAGFAAA